MPIDNNDTPTIGELKEEFVALVAEGKRGLALVFKGFRILLREAIADLEKDGGDANG